MLDDVAAAGCMAVLWLALEGLLRPILRFFIFTGDFLHDLVTLDLFRKDEELAGEDEPLGDDGLPDWLAGLVGFAFWAAFVAAAIWSWPYLGLF